MFELLAKRIEAIICEFMKTANFMIYRLEKSMISNLIICMFTIDDEEYKLTARGEYDNARKVWYIIHVDIQQEEK